MSLLRRPAFVLTVLGIVALCGNAYWIAAGRPQPVVDAVAGRIACVSYAPYRLKGESPFDPKAHVSAERIDADLAALSKRFNCIRTYSVGQGLDQVPAIAERHHMKVLLGIWLSRDTAANLLEMTLATHLAQTQHDAISAIVVGNEVLLRGELAPDVLAADITAMRDATDLPVTYADVWEFWLKYPQIAPAVSFITIHILPYWEDHPVAVEDAVAHVAAIRAQLAAAFPQKDILIGETGWPSAGRQRQGARPSLVNEARFIREFLNWAQPNHVRYNVIEAFDQPWKRLLEGTAGGYWGIYDASLHEKFAEQGPVVEEPRFILALVAGAITGLVFALFALYPGRKGWSGVCAALLLGDGIGLCAAGQIRELLRGERTAQEWGIGIALSLFAAVSAIALSRVIVNWCSDRQPIRAPAGIAEALRGLRTLRITPRASLVVVRFGWLYLGGLMNLLLIFDGRYRDFPTFLYASPVVGLAALAWIEDRAGAKPALEEELLSVWLVISPAIVLVLETLRNGPALLWVLMCVVLGAPGVFHLATRRLRARQQQGA